MPQLTLGLDIGSTSIKAVLFDVEAKQPVGLFSRPLDSRVTTVDPSYYEEDPKRLLDRSLSVLKEAATAAKARGGEIIAIMVTGQMHGGLFVDHALQPLTNCITWQDKRCDESIGDRTLIQMIRQSVPTSEWSMTGGVIYTGFLGGTVHWFLHHDLIPSSTEKIIGIYDWLASLLCGNTAVTDPSSAAAWGLFDIQSMQWSDSILSSLGIPESWLPEVVETGGVIGHLTKAMALELGLRPDIPILSGMGDTQASYIGSGCKPEEILLNFGTGSQLMFERKNFASYVDSDTRYLPNSRYLITVPTLSGGQAYSLLAEFILETVRIVSNTEVEKSELYDIMNDLAQNAQRGAEGIQVAPFFNGSRTKGESLRASIAGLTRENLHLGNLLRATLEGMIEEVAEPYFRLSPDERSHAGLVGSGNGMQRNIALQQVAEARFGLPLRLSPFQEEAALGAAMAAAKIL